MIATISVGVLAVGFAYLTRYTDFKFGLKLSFLVIFLFLAFRYDFGNDYIGYLIDFNELNRYLTINYFDINFHYEPGWLLLCRIFYPLGFFGLVISLAAFNCIVYYRFIERYIPVRYYWFAVFIYTFNPALMLIQASAMRQSLALAIFLSAIPYIIKKEPIKYFILIGIAYSFHSSALVLLPLYFLSFFNKPINRKSGSIILLIFVSLFFSGQVISPFINQFISTNFRKYELYDGQAVISSGLGIFYFFSLLILLLLYERYSNKETRFVLKLSIISFIFIPLSLIIQMIGRIGLYFEASTIVAYPIVLNNIKKSNFKLVFCVYVMIFTIYTFIKFFQSELYGPSFGNYKTIFSVM